MTLDRRGNVLRVNRTFLSWTKEHLGNPVPNFHALLRTGDRIYWETHVAPLLDMQGEVREIALELTIDGAAFPILLNARVSRVGDPSASIDVAAFPATQRRSYEQELLEARQRAEASETLARNLAETLQLSLMPASLPVLAGIELGAAYRPAGRGDEIGGDFYDVFQIAPDSWMVVLGDVRGKGATAASLTGLVRYAIRGSAMQVRAPSEIVRAVNAALLMDGTGETCTAVVIRLDLGTEPSATIALAGHPKPRLVDESGKVSSVGRTGTLLGAFHDIEMFDEVVDLALGDVMVLFTDGVTEARAGDVFFGEDGLDQLLIQVGPEERSPQQIVDMVSSAALEHQGGFARDDIAVVAIRRSKLAD